MKSNNLISNPCNNRLLLVFSGWNTNDSLYHSWTENIPAGWDLIVCYDFDASSQTFDIPQRYKTVYLLAWSLGVAAAEIFLDPKRITAAFAINGTTIATDDQYSIPVTIYEGTQSNLNLRNLLKFRRRMVSSAQKFNDLQKLLPQDPNIEELRAQLCFLADKATCKNPSLPWIRAYISSEDKIIPPENQKHFWTKYLSDNNIVELSEPHYPDLLNIALSIIPDIESVSRQFSSHMSTYDNNAIAQRQIVNNLIRLFKKNIGSDKLVVNSMLEIGSGSGLLTKSIADFLETKESHFVDICQLPVYNVSSAEYYYCENAEDFICDTDHKFDIIISASTIQWFADPVGFIKNAAEKLNDGGYLLLSTFLPDNLRELNSLRPSPVIYHDTSEYEKILSECFNTFQLEEELISLTFKNSREALMNIKLTGVSHMPGKKRHADKKMVSNLSRIQIEAAMRNPDGTATLTYHPLYIFAQK